MLDWLDGFLRTLLMVYAVRCKCIQFSSRQTPIIAAIRKYIASLHFAISFLYLSLLYAFLHLFTYSFIYLGMWVAVERQEVVDKINI